MKISLVAVGFAFLAHSALAAEAPAPADKSCVELTELCVKAGFKQGGAGEGVGLYAHCMQPLLTGAKPKIKAKKPLPKASKALIAKCKAAGGK